MSLGRENYSLAGETNAVVECKTGELGLRIMYGIMKYFAGCAYDVSLDYGAHYGFHVVYENDLNRLNQSGCLWLTAIGFWLQCLANKY